MLKYMHTFESYGELDMPVNSSFSTFDEFKNYLSDPEIKDLVNRLNNLWWEMEQGDVEDEIEMNDYGTQLDNLENEIRETINQKATNVDELEDEGLSYESEELNDLFKRSNLNIKVLTDEVNINGIKLNLNIDDDEYNASITSKGDFILIEDSYMAYMGNVYDNITEVLNKFKELVNTYGDEYIKFFKDNEASL